MSEPTVTYDDLIRFAAGELIADEARRVEARVEQDPAAALTVSRFRMVQATARADDSVAPPDSVLVAAKALYRERAVPQQPRPLDWLERLTRIVAELIFDSRTQAAAAGLRGQAATYQLGYETDVADVDLEIEGVGPAGPRVIRGQAMPHDADERIGAVALLGADAAHVVATATPDKHGFFTLSAERGHYRLALQAGERVIVIPDLEVE